MFSFIDKIISSFSAMIQGFALTLAGVGNVVIKPNEPVNSTFNMAIMVCFCIVPILGHIATIIAMRWYNLDKVKWLKSRKSWKTGRKYWLEREPARTALRKQLPEQCNKTEKERKREEGTERYEQGIS